METNGTNPKRLVANFFFLVAAVLLLYILVSAFSGLGSSVCTSEEIARGLSKCNNSVSPLAGFLAGGIMGGLCCFPPAIVFFILGAFFWSGAKKDDLRDLEIRAYHKGEKGGKKTEAI